MLAFGSLKENIIKYKYEIVLGLLLLLCLTALVTVGGRVASDGYNYYAYLRSAVIDGDLDFHNDFQNYGGAFWQTYKPKDTITGHFTNVFSIGPALLWAPFYLITHAVLLGYNILGGSIPVDGFSEPYQLSIAVATQLYTFLGILLMFRLMKKYYLPAASFIAALGVWLGTFLVYYMIFEPSMSHGLSFFAVTLFTYLWFNSRPERSKLQWIWLGLSAGLMMLIRWQNGIFMALPAIEALWLYYQALKTRNFPMAKSLLANNLTFLLAVVVAFIPQMLVWKIIYGGFLTIPQGSSFMKWTAPFVTETLFSSRHGLFSWHPLLLLGALGWLGLFKRDRLLTAATLLLFVLMTYVNSVVSDWWSGWAFGMRRFDGFLVFLGLGLAGTITWLMEFVRRKPVAVVTVLVMLLITSNVLFMNQFRGRVVHQGGVVSFEGVYKNMVAQVYARTGNPFSFPANQIFAFNYGEPPGRYDSLVGVYVDDRYFYGSKMDMGRQRFYLGKGWSSANESWQGHFDYLRSNQSAPRIYMPLRNKSDYQIILRMAPLQGTSESAALAEPIPNLAITLNSSTLKTITLAEDWQVYSLAVAADQVNTGINVLELNLPPGTVIGVDYIEFVDESSRSSKR